MNLGDDEPRTRLEKLLRDREALAEARYSAAELEKMALQSEAEAAKLTRLGEGGAPMTEEDREKARREQLTTQAVTLLTQGVDPKIVGQILSGSTPVSVSMPQGGGISMEWITGMMHDMMEARHEAELAKIEAAFRTEMAEVRAELKSGRGNGQSPPDPLTQARNAAEFTKTLYDAWKEMGLIKEPVIRAPGTSIDELRESHRHDERMEELKIDRRHKESLAEIAADIPVRIGKGVADHLRENNPGKSNPKHESEPEMEILTCEDCNSKIYVPPEAGDTVTCGKCGAQYKRS